MRRGSKRKLLLLVSLALSLLWAGRHLRPQRAELQLSDWFDPRKRPDVVTTTDWLAPVIWEGTFDRRALYRHYRRQNLTVGLVVFAVGRAAHRYLEPFLRSADKHFLPGFRVVTYVLAESWLRPPALPARPLRAVRVLAVRPDRGPPGRSLWRLQSLGAALSAVQAEADFVFSMSVDRVFRADVGAEVLGAAVAQLHAWWFFRDRRHFPYERRPRSAACIPAGQGDFFYDGAVLGGAPARLLALLRACLAGAWQDALHGLHSTFESHLNKYFFLHKPSTLLSPEYNWDASFHPPLQVRLVRVLQLGRRDPDP
uniref:Glycosyltransferase 6 domain containing 1 n=1 Tax=Pipistrellus kuhlii TaxID=59472 RepID=A0A7J7RVW2_PIPKU|nr:hypothetical protein mPipKuh1_005630 [Pipistrellus kuhlii]